MLIPYKILFLITYSVVALLLLYEVVFWGLIKQDSILLFWEDWTIAIVLLYISLTSIIFSINPKTVQTNSIKKNLDDDIFENEGNYKKYQRFLVVNNLFCGILIIIYNTLNLIQEPIYSFTFYEERYFINPILILFGSAQIHYTILMNRKYEYYK